MAAGIIQSLSRISPFRVASSWLAIKASMRAMLWGFLPKVDYSANPHLFLPATSGSRDQVNAVPFVTDTAGGVFHRTRTTARSIHERARTCDAGVKPQAEVHSGAIVIHGQHADSVTAGQVAFTFARLL